MLDAVLNALADLIYPAHCLLCEKHLPNRGTIHVCNDCLAEVSSFDRNICNKCGHPTGPYARNDKRCPNCRNARLHFRRAVAVGRYRGPIKKLVTGLKFRCDSMYAVPLGKMISDLATRLNLHHNADLVVPVPLHRTRRAERGFNQSELIAQEVSERLRLPLSIENLRRIRNTATQTRFTRAQRERNMREAFSVSRPKHFDDKIILLIDDVMTTGATTSECARMLYDAGALSVTVLTAAR